MGNGLSCLSKREILILRLITAGENNKQLEIAGITVEFHVSNIFRKLNLKSRIQATVCGARNGL